MAAALPPQPLELLFVAILSTSNRGSSPLIIVNNRQHFGFDFAHNGHVTLNARHAMVLFFTNHIGAKLRIPSTNSVKDTPPFVVSCKFLNINSGS